MIVMLRCISPFQTDVALHTTELHRCPDSVRYEYRLKPDSALEAAILKHYDNLPRDDRMEVIAKKKPSGRKKRVAKHRKKR